MINFLQKNTKHSYIKKTKRGLAFIIASALVLSGCGLADDISVSAPVKEPLMKNVTDENSINDEEQSKNWEQKNQVVEIEEPGDKESEGEENSAENDSEKESSETTQLSSLTIYTDEELASAAAVVAGRYAYESLNADEKRVYKQMYLALMSMSQGAKIDTLDNDAVQKIFACVYMDNPEIFWTNGYTFTQYKRGDILEAIGFAGTYTIDAQEMANRQSRIDSVVANCIANVPAGDDYVKIKYIYEYIIKNTEYDKNSIDNQNICSVFLNGRSVCQGYAKAMQYLLNKIGIKCTLVNGTVTSGESHAWDLVYADGAYYYVDPTWGDATFQVNGEFGGKTPDITYDYLCVPDSELFKTHRLSTVIGMPTCQAMADNYFVRENLYFTGVNEEQLAALFNNSKASGKEMVIVKCADSNVYSAMKQYLINEQNIFKYIDNGQTISYFQMDDQCYIGFWL